jgi:hypothetical protein
MKHLIVRLIALIVSSLAFSGAMAGTLDATFKVTPDPDGKTSSVEVRINPPTFDQLLIWLWQPGGTFQRGFSRPVNPSQPGVYRFELPTQGGMWNYYMRVGPGQAGFIGRGRMFAPDTVGGSSESRGLLQNQFDDTVPAYVQPVGYTVWAVTAALALWLVAVILGRLGRRTRTA